MPWPEFHYQQQELELLIKPWVEQSAEYHMTNELYGASEIIKKYAGLAVNRPLPWAMEHFLSFDDPEPFHAELTTTLPIILAATSGQREILLRHVRKPVYAIGSIWYYMRDQYHQQHQEDELIERRGTIVFPDKSTIHKHTAYDRAAFASRLATLPDEYQPIYVSMFWKDILNGDHHVFADAGLKIVTSGISRDPLFLFRQYDLCRQFRYACANDISTSFCMAILAGCRFFHLPSGPMAITQQGQTKHYAEEPTLHLPAKQACLTAASFPPTRETVNAQLELAKRYSGLSDIKPPDFFRQLVPVGEQALLTRSPDRLDINHINTRDGLAPWLMIGVDSDGWGERRCEITLCPRDSFAGWIITIHQPGHVGVKRVRWTIWRNNVPTTLKIPPGDWQIEIPIESVVTTLVIETDHDLQLTNETRRRAWRLLTLHASTFRRWFRTNSIRYTKVKRQH